MENKPYNTMTLIAAGMFWLASVPAAEAASASSELEQLKQQVQMLTQQNQQLNQRLTEMEATVSASKQTAETATTEEPKAKTDDPAEEKAESGLKINEMLTLSGSIEGDFIVAEDVAGNSSSEFNLDTVELIFDLTAT